MTQADASAPWDDPDRAVQIEDDNPEALAGDEVDFDPDAADPDAAEPDADDEGEGA